MRVSRTASVAVFITLSYLKEPLAFVSDLIIPLIVFMVVHLGTGRGVEPLLGILVAISWSSGSFALAKKLAPYKLWRLLDMFLVSPLKPLEFAVATELVIIVVPATIVVAVMVVISATSFALLLLIAISIIMTWLMGTFFGLYIYGKLADPLRVSSIANLLNLLLILLPPVMYPISILPTAVQLASSYTDSLSEAGNATIQ